MAALQHDYPLAAVVYLGDKVHVVQGWLWDAFAGGACLIITGEGRAPEPLVLDPQALVHLRRV